MKRSLLLVIALAVPALASASDLSLTNYQTDYTRVNPLAPGVCWAEGTLALAVTADPCHPSWETSGDYDGDGQQLLVNSMASQAGARVIGWTVETQAGREYTWSTWLKNLYDGPRAVVAFYVDGVQHGQGYLGAAGLWFETAFTFVAAGDKSNLEARELSAIYDGADWSLDHSTVTATPTPEVGTMLQVGTGLIGFGAMVRRRSHVVLANSARAVWRFIQDERGGSLNL